MVDTKNSLILLELKSEILAKQIQYLLLGFEIFSKVVFFQIKNVETVVMVLNWIKLQQLIFY